ncbi:MAG: glycosyltransferase family 2 protein [DPANN group archaeon]|nr:glycosyltransferase family 2 protein [DPANN group archaeon]
MGLISIVMPAYNEEGRIGGMLSEYCEYFSNKIKDFEFVIIVQGTDKTINIVKDFAKKYPQINYTYSEKRSGKGGAIIEGFKRAKGSIIGFVDADGSTRPDAFFDLIKQTDLYDGAIASKRMPGAIITKNEPALQQFGGYGFNWLLRFLFLMPFKDTQCGAKIFRKDVISSILPELGVTEFAFDADLLLRIWKKGFKIKEVPTTWEYKAGSTFDFRKWFWRLIPNMLMSLMRLRLLYSPFNGFVKFWDKYIKKVKI